MNIGLTQRMYTVIGRFELGSAVRGFQARKSDQRVFRTAMWQAYNLVGRHYCPRWASYLLDKELQVACERPLRAAYLEGQPRIAPAELAGLWADRVEWMSNEARHAHMPELVDVAGRFIRCLDQELCERKAEWKNMNCAG